MLYADAAEMATRAYGELERSPSRNADAIAVSSAEKDAELMKRITGSHVTCESGRQGERPAAVNSPLGWRFNSRPNSYAR
jgi:hypothetical protein